MRLALNDTRSELNKIVNLQIDSQARGWTVDVLVTRWKKVDSDRVSIWITRLPLSALSWTVRTHVRLKLRYRNSFHEKTLNSVNYSKEPWIMKNFMWGTGSMSITLESYIRYNNFVQEAYNLQPMNRPAKSLLFPGKYECRRHRLLATTLSYLRLTTHSFQ